jgi:hypothetical protein
MCPACLVAMLMAGVGTAGGASALLWSRRRRRAQAKPSRANPEPPSATFKEWVAAVVSLEEALRASSPQLTARGGSHPSGLTDRV